MSSASLKKVVIVGSGLGGLLTGAYLATRHYDVTVCESLGILGGRFSHIDYDGFAVPTGAFHALPGGEHGPISQCLDMIGLKIDLVTPTPSFMMTLEGVHHPVDLHQGLRGYSGLRKKLGMQGKLRIAAEAAWSLCRSIAGIDCSVACLISKLSAEPMAFSVFDHLTKFSIGVPASDASVVDITRSLLVQNFGREGFLRNGNRALISSLEQKIIDAGGKIKLLTPITRVAANGGSITGVTTRDGAFIPADIVILNTGYKKAFDLLGSLVPDQWHKLFTNTKSAAGAGHAIRSRHRMHKHSSIEIPVELESIAGIVPISAIAPALCPSDWHYSLAYQYLDDSIDVDQQIGQAHDELKQYLGDAIEIFNTAIYRNGHPAAGIAQCVGQHGGQRLPAEMPTVKNVYFVGHDVCGYGIAAEVIGYSCKRLWKRF